MVDIPGIPGSGGSVDPSQQIVIYFGGFFDQTVMGAPMYFWAIFTMGMIGILFFIFVMYHRYFILDKIWGFVECYKSGKPLALIRTRNRTARLKPLHYVAQMFEDEESPDRWFATSLETSSSMSGVSLVDVVDYYDWVQDPILNQAIREIATSWNETHSDEEKIYDYARFQELLGSGQLVDYFDKTEVTTYIKGTVRMPAFFVVDIRPIEQYLPKTRSSAMFGGYIQWTSDNVNTKDKVDWKSYMLPVMALCTLMIICGLIAGLLGTGKL